MKKINKLKARPLIFLLLVIVLVSIGGTIAYFSNEFSFANKFKTSTYNIQIEEEFNNTWGTKKVYFANNEETNVPVVIRINFNELWSNYIDGTLITLNNNVNGTNVVNKNWTTDFTNNFIKGSDGWYYYKKKLNAKEKVQVLDSIELNENLISTSPDYNNYKTYDYELSFNFEAIQADKKAVKEIWGYDINIDGSDIIWPF